MSQSEYDDFILDPAANTPLVAATLNVVNDAELNEDETPTVTEVINGVDDLNIPQEVVREEFRRAYESAKEAQLKQDAHKISFIVITQASDSDKLERMLKSLPKRVEVCIVVTEKSDRDFFEIDGEFINDERIYRLATWQYKQFSFATARNHSLSLATNDWCIWIDSDDLLLEHQHEDILAIQKLPIGIGGVQFGCFGYHAPWETFEGGQYYAATHLRAFRKSSGVQFRGIVHEQIQPQIEAVELKIITSQILVLHTGYATNKAELNARLQRNLSLLKLQVATSDYLQGYYEAQLAKTITTIHELKGQP